MLRIVRLKPTLLLPAVIGVVFVIVALFFTRRPFPWTGGAIGAFATVFTVGAARAKFRSGALLPGVVVSADPVLVACLTDLSTGRSDQAFMMVAVQPVPKAWFATSGREPRVGDACPMCALYRGQMNKAAWDGFDPDPVWLATSRPDVVSAAIEQVPEQDWKELDAALARLPQPVSKGRYRVDLSDVMERESGWTEKQLGRV